MVQMTQGLSRDGKIHSISICFLNSYSSALRFKELFVHLFILQISLVLFEKNTNSNNK